MTPKSMFGFFLITSRQLITQLLVKDKFCNTRIVCISCVNMPLAILPEDYKNR